MGQPLTLSSEHLLKPRLSSWGRSTLSSSRADIQKSSLSTRLCFEIVASYVGANRGRHSFASTRSMTVLDHFHTDVRSSTLFYTASIDWSYGMRSRGTIFVCD